MLMKTILSRSARLLLALVILAGASSGFAATITGSRSTTSTHGVHQMSRTTKTATVKHKKKASKKKHSSHSSGKNTRSHKGFK